jgi:hypothetical protein
VSYSFGDFFDDKILPRLKDLKKDDSDASDKFLQIMREAFGDNQNDSFVRWVVTAIVNPHQEETTSDRLLRQLFNLLQEEMELRKVEYTDGNAVIKVNYNGISEEQDLVNRIATYGNHHSRSEKEQDFR